MGIAVKYIQKEFKNCFEEKKSKFIAYFMPYSKFDEVMKRLRAEHAKARHFVYSYRYLNELSRKLKYL